MTAVIKLRSISGCYGVVNEGLGAIEGWQVEICNNGHLEWDGVTGVDSTNVIEAGKYYFVAISNTSATSRLFYAVDLSDGSVDVNQVDTTNISVPVNADRPLRIGVYTFSNGTNTDYFNGSVDDVRIYNRALSAGEIAKLYQSGAVKFSGSSVALQNGSSLANGLVGLWTFDGGDTHWTSETTGTTDDRSGAGNTGTLTNMNRRTSVDGGKLGQALTFNGSSSYVETSQSQAVTSSISMSAWIKADDLNRKQVIVNQNTDGAGLELVNDGGAIGEVNFYTGDGGGVNFNETGAYTGSLPTLSPGVWYHIVGVFDDAANTITLYLNGQVYDSDTANFAHNTAATTFRIGQAGTWIGEADYFSGSIDDVRIYNRALTAAEVKQLYLLGGVKVK